MRFAGKKIAVGVTGGIACYKTCEVVSTLKKQGADVFVVMTKNACNFVNPLTFETLSGNRVVTDTFDRNFEHEVGHISLSKKVDAFLIAPASANFVGKYALGIADDFLSTTIMAFTKSVVIAPAMNTNMIMSEQYINNENTLRKRGVFVVESGSGMLACGDSGKGRMAEPSEIVDYLYSVVSPNRDYKGKTVLVTAGATRENIDPVRYITNHSSGKMGSAIADSVVSRGGSVIFIHGQNCVMPKKLMQKAICVTTTNDMYNAVMDNLEQADIVIKSAAPSDYIVKMSDCKIKSKTLTLQLEKNVDIASCVGKVKGDKKLVVFSAETENLVKNATEKLSKKNADLVVANDVTMEGAGFNSDTNIVTIISKDGAVKYDKLAKSQVADIILDSINNI